MKDIWGDCYVCEVVSGQEVADQKLTVSKYHLVPRTKKSPHSLLYSRLLQVQKKSQYPLHNTSINQNWHMR